MIYLTLLLVVSIFIYFEVKFRKLGKKDPASSVNTEYPKSIVYPFEFHDLDDFETSVFDIINLVINEQWDHQIGYNYRPQIVFTRDNLVLLLEYDKSESDNEFTISLSNFDFGEGYDRKQQWVNKKILSFRGSSIEKSHKKLYKNINRFIHQHIYQEMVKERESSKFLIMKKKSQLDEILTSVRRDRRIDDILNN